MQEQTCSKLAEEKPEKSKKKHFPFFSILQ